MDKKRKRIFKIAGISVVSFVAVVLLLITIMVNWFFTPDKLTPLVLHTANQTLNAKLDMKRVELTFFSTFPRFGLKLTDGALVSKAMRDTLWQQTDSLISFEKCVVVVNPFDYIIKNRITLNYLGLEGASVYAYKGKDGVANWDITKKDIPETTDTVSVSSSPVAEEINIRRVSFKRTNVVFDDRDTRIYTRLTNANLFLKASLKKGYSVLKLDFCNDNLLFWQDGQLLADKIAAALTADLELNRSIRTLAIKEAGLTVNGIALDLNGTLKRDTIRKAVAVNMHYGLHAPSLETVLHMIPESIVKKEEVHAKGEVLLEGDVKGYYGKEQTPLITLKAKIKEASAKYDKLPYGIDNLTADFYGAVDLTRKTTSYADLKIFRFQGAHTDVLADAKIQDLLGDPDITFNTKSTIDLTALAQTFPLQEGVTVGGKVDADLHLNCRLSSIMRQDLGRIKLGGKLNMTGLTLRDTNQNFEFASDAKLAFIGKDNLAARIEITKMILHSRLASSELNRITATIKSTNPQDTTRIIDMECKLDMNQLKASMGDSVRIFCRKAKSTVRIQPGEMNPDMPKIGLNLESDTLFCRLGAMKMGMDKAGFGVTAEKLHDSLWAPKGIIGFNRLFVSTPEFALPVRLRKTAVTIGDRTITLRNASMRIGHSNLTASGAVYNLYESLKENKTIHAKLNISSRNLDCNQLINALNFPEDTLQAETDTASNDLQLFVIPKNIDFELHTKLDRVKYDSMVFEDVQGDIDIRNQAVYLKGINMKGMDAQMTATLVYRAKEKRRGYAGFDFKLRDVDVSKLVDFVPSLDTIVPMLRSFKGFVDFDAAAEAVVDSNLNIRIPSLRSAMHIKGDSLVLMDGETFAEISKKLMFKNKKRNVFDSISANITVKDGYVTVYPFLVQIDRYKAAVGGTQDLNMNFNYHISILKSPLPFKAGVTITGNMDKMKFRIGKAKYKDAVTPIEIRKVDSTRIHMGQQIVEDFRRVIKR